MTSAKTQAGKTRRTGPSPGASVEQRTGVALAPPRYGIDLADLPSAEVVPEQATADVASLPSRNSVGILATAAPPPTVQAKLTIGDPNDAYEQEADRIAEAVMRMPGASVRGMPEAEEEPKGLTVQTKPLAEQITLLIQRQVNQSEQEAEGEEGAVQTKGLSNTAGRIIHREAEAEAEEEEKLEEEEEQEKGTLQPKADRQKMPPVSTELEGQLNRLQGRGDPLAISARAFFEPRFGQDFGQVRVHADGQAASAAQALYAQAFTRGHDIFFGAGCYQPDTPSGQKLLAHELTHTIQQTGTRPLATSAATASHPGGQSGLRVKRQPSHLELTRGMHSLRDISRGPAVVFRRARPAGAEVAEIGLARTREGLWPDQVARFRGAEAEGVAQRDQLEADLETIVSVLDELHYSDSNEQTVISILERWAALGPDRLDWLFDRLTRKTTRRGALRETTSYYSLIFNHFDRVDDVRAIRDTFSRSHKGDEGIAEASLSEQLKEGGWKTTAKEYWGKKFKQLGEDLDAIGTPALLKQLLGGVVGVIQGFAELAVELVEGVWSLAEAILHLHGAFFYFITGALQGAGLGFLKNIPLVGHVFNPSTYRSSYDKTLAFFESAGAALQNPEKIWAGIKEAASTAWGEVMTEYAAADAFNKSRIIARGVVKVGMAVGGVIKSLPQFAKGAVKFGATVAKVASKTVTTLAKALRGTFRIAEKLVRGTWRVIREPLENGQTRLRYFFKRTRGGRIEVTPEQAKVYVKCSTCSVTDHSKSIEVLEEFAEAQSKLSPGWRALEETGVLEKYLRTLYEKHHLLVKQYKRLFKKRGINIDDYTIKLPIDEHKLIHNEYNWNKIWKDFFVANKQADKVDIIAQMEKMTEKYGLKGLPIVPY